MAFEKRYLDETPSADVRVIIPTEDKTGEEILEEWKSGAATEDSFAELCKKYTQDTSAVENGRSVRAGDQDRYDRGAEQLDLQTTAVRQEIP